MNKIDYEDNFMDQEIVIDETLADKLNGRCFIDLDMPDRIEGFKFTKTKTGLDCLWIGCDCFWAYHFSDHEDYGTYKIKDTSFGTDVNSVLTDFYLIKEVTEDVFNEMQKIVNDVDEKSKQMKVKFDKTQHELWKKADLK